METMRAAMYDRYGTPDVLYVGTRPRPRAGPGQVLVRVRAASVNGGELHARAGRVRAVTAVTDRGGFPRGLGIDFVGTVEETAADVEGFARGDAVWGVLPRRFGAAADYVVISSNLMSHAPSGMDPVQAAALPGVATTAITALRDKAAVRAGDRVLIRGAAGGVGSVAVQFAHASGARVTALAGARAADLVHDLGADEVIDYASVRPGALGPFDVVLDTVGTEHRAYRRLLAPGGRMTAIAFDLAHPGRSLGYILASAVHRTERVRFFSGAPERRALREVAELAEAGTLRPVVHATFPLAEIADAHRMLEAGGVGGKIVLAMDD